MTTYVALLRGINVGGKNLIKMPELKACFEQNGFADVATYIQSGNVLFASPASRNAPMTDRIEEMLAESFDYIPTVVVRSRKQMRSIVDGAPVGFGSRPAEYRYDVFFLKGRSQRRGRSGRFRRTPRSTRPTPASGSCTSRGRSRRRRRAGSTGSFRRPSTRA